MNAKRAPTLLDFSLVEKNLEQQKEELNISGPLALQAVMLHSILNLDQIQIENVIVDGSNDCGIDGIYIDEDEDRSTVYIYQSKLITKKEKVQSHFPGSAIDKMCYAIDNYILKPIPEEYPAYINPQLRDKIQDVRNVLDEIPKIELIFLNNGIEANSTAKTKLSHWINDKNKSGDIFSYRFIDIIDLTEVLAPSQTTKIDAELRLSGEYADWSGRAGIRTVIGKISAITLAKLREKNGPQLFEKNIRGYLGLNNQKSINQRILTSASGDKAHHFFVLNNGITIVCKKLRYSPVDDSPTIHLKDMQIVNGGQTTNSIYEAYRQGRPINKASILVKIIETENDDLLADITEATNSQTPVTARDLKSNDQIQRSIEQQLKLQGYFYESRQDKYKSEAPRDKRIDAPVAAQAFFAYELGRPVEAKNQKRLLFTDFYDAIFDSGNHELADQLLNSFFLYRKIHNSQKAYKDKYSFYSHAELTILALMKRIGIDSNTDDIEFTKVLEKILDLTKKLVSAESKELGEKYSHRQLFINKDTLNRLNGLY